jgi:hypothetical protein
MMCKDAQYIGIEDKFMAVTKSTDYIGEFIETRRVTINNDISFVFSTKEDYEF